MIEREDAKERLVAKIGVDASYLPRIVIDEIYDSIGMCKDCVFHTPDNLDTGICSLNNTCCRTGYMFFCAGFDRRY